MSNRTNAADAVVIGAGQNGLVAANLLQDAGWSVLVLEAEDTVGGAVRSDSELVPGFVHDTFSAFYPLAVVSPVIAAMHLEEHGLTWLRSPGALANPTADGWAAILRTPEETAAAFDAVFPGDGEAWMDMCRGWQRIGDDVVGALLSPFPPVRHGLKLLAKAPAAGGLDLARLAVLSVRRLGEERFGGFAPRLLLAGNALHADFHPEGAGSGVFGWLLTMLAQHVGYPSPQGGAGALTAAMADRFIAHGGQIRTNARVERIEVSGGRAVAVRTTGGERYQVGRAVLADVVAPHLYGGLVAWEDLPPRTRTGMRRFDWDPGTVKVDWALSGPVPWRTPMPGPSACFHIAESVDELSRHATQISTGAVPSDPLLLAGAMDVVDPSRSPEGGATAWSYTHVPREVRTDAGGDGLTGAWDESEKERLADRMQARIERHAPGFGDRVLARRVLGPADLQARNSNLDGGAINGGTAALSQELVFRPYPGLGRAGTPVRGLFLANASAHPGGGVHGGPGSNAARAALAQANLRRI
jgi:phytoene dehydrogenase-like protein